MNAWFAMNAVFCFVLLTINFTIASDAGCSLTGTINQSIKYIYFMSDLHGLVEHKYITQKSLKTILKISLIFYE